MHVVEVMALLQAKVKGLINKLLFFFRSWFFDVEYTPLSYNEIKEFLEYWVEHELPLLTYVEEKFDCDDFAGYFKYLVVKALKKNGVFRAIGKVYYKGEFLGYHAWNGVILEDGTVAYIEPQTGDLFYGDTLYDWKYELQAVLM